MPITKELENLRKFESVGFTHEQSEVLTDVIEQSHVNGQQSLKEFISGKFEELRSEMDDRFKELRTEMGDRFKDVDGKFKDVDSKFKDVDSKFKDVRHEITSSELRIRASHTDLLVKILAIAAGCTSIGIAISRVWK